MKISFRELTVSFAAALMMVAGSATAGALTSKISVDNSYRMYLSTSDSVVGSLVDSGADWGTTYIDNNGLIAGVTYYLHILAQDEGGVAGFLGEFSLTGAEHKFSNGTTMLLTNTTDWKANTTGFNGIYGAVSAWGTDGVSPWGNRPGIDDTATWIWSGDRDSVNTVYFTTKITATGVPEPTSIALLGLGLLGLGAARRRSNKAK